MSGTGLVDVEVLVAGGGPVGLCLAFLLAEAGVSVELVEGEAEPVRDLRASTFHPPTLDLLGPSGIADELVARGLICPSWQIRLHPSGERAVFDLGVLAGDTRHPYRLQCEQWKLSEALAERLTGSPRVGVRRGARVTGLTQDEDHVRVSVASGTGDETISARFLVGADGARSIVRKTLGLEFAGETYPETTILATTTFPFEEHLEGLSNVSYCWKEGGNFSLLKVPGRWRVSIYPREDLSLEEQLAPDAIEDSLQAIVPRPEPYEVGEIRPYRVHQRIVARYVQGRVALAGDAAHVNSPAGGMGLNGGLHDAFELAAALTDCLRQGRGPERLDRYDRRRRPVAAEQILKQADRNRSRMRERDPERRRAMLADLQAVTRDREKLRAHLLQSSMIEGLRQAARIT